MSYLVLARKYRPQRFDEIVGQEHITKTLKNAIKMGKISHAYLFTGPRGIGKTTTARILAKAVNCTNRETEEPCNECTSCREITSTESVDVIEIDAASNRGIDEIRELRQNVKFAPASSKYKVYIIDEVHMLTKEAFNAILKTLEEPPEHVIFVMATTEPEKVLDTIHSRCQTFNFKLIPERSIIENLKQIARQEEAEYDQEGLSIIARAAEGSIRDAQSIMDQCLSFAGGKINEKEVSELLGLIPREFMFEYTEYIKNNEVKKAVELTDKLYREGFSIQRLFTDLMAHFRNLMFARVFGEATGFLGFGKDYSKKLAQSAEGFSKEHLIWITEFLTKNTSRLKYSDNPQIVMDTIIFKLCQRYVGFDDVLKAAEKMEKEPEKKENKSPDYPREEQPISSTHRKTKKTPAKGGKWERILKNIKRESEPLYHFLKESKVSLDKKDIIIKNSSPVDFSDRQMKILRDSIKKVMGEKYKPVLKKVKKKKQKKNKIKKKNPNPLEIEEEEPVVREIVDLFKGRVEK
ncbi:MAG: DNA polymerase III subunit gamma/tau [Elusimicrobiota bacterium]